MFAGVLVSIPAQVEFIHVVRSVVASVAARLDFSLDEIEDLTLAADEACATVLEAVGSHGSLQVEATQSPGGDALQIEVRTGGEVKRWPPEGLRGGMGWQVLSTLADEIRFEQADGSLVLSLTKRRSQS